jgi:hypothetical protein
MNLEISSFAEVGDLLKERIVLKALTNLDVGDYALFQSGTGPNRDEPLSGRKTAYWFPDEEVKAGDLVVLYTKKGTKSTKPLNGGRTAYFFYWGLNEALWASKDSGAVVLEIAAWQFKTSR